jgi:hypothetical protein
VAIRKKLPVAKDGKMWAHIGYGPVFEEEPNFKKSALENVTRPGSGQTLVMAAIMAHEGRRLPGWVWEGRRRAG